MEDKAAESSVQQFPCPICKKMVTPGDEYAPFCSKRCKMVDLNNWLDGAYSISRPLDWENDLEDQ